MLGCVYYLSRSREIRIKNPLPEKIKKISEKWFFAILGKEQIILPQYRKFFGYKDIFGQESLRKFKHYPSALVCLREGNYLLTHFKAKSIPKKEFQTFLLYFSEYREKLIELLKEGKREEFVSLVEKVLVPLAIPSRNATLYKHGKFYENVYFPIVFRLDEEGNIDRWKKIGIEAVDWHKSILSGFEKSVGIIKSLKEER
jgi:hypothetical protein